jgi:HEAT repeat protein
MYVPKVPDELEDPAGLLVEALEEDPELRGTVARVLGRIGEAHPELVTEDIDRLATIATTADPDGRKTAISSLGRIGATDPAVVGDTLDTLIDAAGAQDASVRRRATEALGQIGATNPSLIADNSSVLVERLQDDEELVRTKAAEACAEIASAAPEHLTDCIEALGVLAADGDEEQQEHAVEALSEIASESPAATAVVTDQLVTALRTDDGDISSAAAGALADIGTSDVPVPSATVDAIAAALSQSGVVGVNAGSVLCEITEATPATTVDHFDTIVEPFDDGDLSARRSITEMLRTHSRQCPSMVEPHVETLAMALNDEDQLLQKDAAYAIGNLAGTGLSGRKNIVEFLADRLADSDDTGTRISAAYAILALACEEGEMDAVAEDDMGPETDTGQQDDSVDEALVEDAMTTLLDIIEGASHSDSVAAISIFGRLTEVPGAYTEQVTDALRSYVSDKSDPEVRAAAIRALGSVATVAPDRIRTLEEALEAALVAQDAKVRAASVETLGHLTATSSEPAPNRTARIEMALEDRSAAVQEAAARALGRVGRDHPSQIQDAIDPVLSRLLDDRQTVRRGALSAVERLFAGFPDRIIDRNRIEPLIEAVATDPIGTPPEAIEALAIAAEHDVEIGPEVVAGIVELISTSAVPPRHRQQALSIVRSVADRDRASGSTIDSDELISALEGVLTADSAELRRAAVLTLSKCCSSRDDTARDLLRDRLHDDPDPGVRRAANDALVTLRTTSDSTPEGDQQSRSPSATSVAHAQVDGDDDGERGSTDSAGPDRLERIPADVLEVEPGSVSWDHLEREQQLGTGGYAAVVRATVPDRDRPIALKLPRGYAESRDATEHNLPIEILTTEGNRWRHLQESGTHPNIVTLLDTGRVQGAPWLALEYMDGGTLADRQNDVTVEEALWITTRIADALQYAHRYMGTHQDVKPTNILFRQTPEGTPDWPKLGDWGVATFGIEDRQSVDAFSESYAAPEQLIADEYGRPSQLTDVYQLGAVCYELMTGTPPDSVHERPTPPSECVDIQQPVDEILGTALAPSPDDRYGSMAQFKNALDRLL